MSDMSDEMDACMHAMGHAGWADMHETSHAMMEELADHVKTVCASSDTETRRPEVERHCRSMRGLIDHQESRAGQLHDMLGGMRMMSESGCHPMGGSVASTAIPVRLARGATTPVPRPRPQRAP